MMEHDGDAVPKVLVVDGPNLNLLGLREPAVYGSATLDDIHALVGRHAQSRGVELEFVQSNSEGDLVTAVQSAAGRADGIVINPAAYTHTSIALRDALSAVGLPAVEVHLTNVHAREEFRHHSFVSGVVEAVIAGAGPLGYVFALDLLIERHLATRPGVRLGRLEGAIA
jgi:3-dehydroquinate dehydratase-2